MCPENLRGGIPPGHSIVSSKTGLPFPDSEAPASYEWGLLLPSFHMRAPAVEEGESAIRQELTFRDKEGFEAYKAIHHELAHYAQDLFTGLGCRTYELDVYAMQDYVRACRANGKDISHESTILFLNPVCITRSLSSLRVRLRYPWAVERSLQWDFDTYSLLEADATSSVHELLARRLSKGDLRDFNSSARSMVEEELKEPRYSDTYLNTRRALLEIMQRSERYRYTHALQHGDYFSPFFAFSRFLTDFAFTVPRLLGEGARREHAPSLRYMDALSVLHRMTGDDVFELHQLAFKDPSKAFAVLDEGCGFETCSWDSNPAWEEWLNAAYEATGDRIALMRKKAINYKRTNYFGYIHRDASWLLADAGIPVFVRFGGSILEGWPSGIPDDRQSYIDRIEEHASYMFSLLRIIDMTNLYSLVEMETHKQYIDTGQTISEQCLQRTAKNVEGMLISRTDSEDATMGDRYADPQDALLAENIVIAVMTGLAARGKIDWDNHKPLLDQDLAHRVLLSAAGCQIMRNERNREGARSAVKRMLVAAGLCERQAEEVFETTLTILLEASNKERATMPTTSGTPDLTQSPEVQH